MYKTLGFILVFVFIAGASKGVSDTLQFHYGRSIFASFQNQQWWNPEISWKNKYRDYDAGGTREAYLFSRSLLVWRTDAWHLAQTIETLAWVLALLLAVRLRGVDPSGILGTGSSGRDASGKASPPPGRVGAAFWFGLFVASLAVFYGGFLSLYGWLLAG